MSEPSRNDVLRFVEAIEKWLALRMERVRIKDATGKALNERDHIAYQAHITFLGDGSDYVAGFRAGQRYAAATWRALDRIACGKLIDICLGEYGRVEDQDADINDCLRELFSVREPDEPTPTGPRA